MSVHTIVLMLLFVAILVGIRSKHLSRGDLLVCGLFGLLIADTGVGTSINGFVTSVLNGLAPTIAGWFS